MGGGQSFETQLPDGGNHQTKLLYCETWRVDSANRLFGACYNGNTVIMINPGRNPVKPYICVPEGMYALVQNQGRDLDYENEGVKSAVWPAGFHWAGPFTKVSHLVTKQYIVFETPVKGCKTADDVTVRIDICLIFRIMGDTTKGEDPELVRRFVYELGPNGLEVQLRAAQDEAVRGLARSVMHTEVYKLRDGTMKEEFSTGGLEMVNRGMNDNSVHPLPGQEKLDLAEDGIEAVSGAAEHKPLYYVTEDIKKNLNKQFNNYGVKITSVAITNVKLPTQFQEQMQSRTTHLSAIKEQNMKQMSDMQLLQYKEEIDTTKLARRMMLMEEEQTGKAKCAEIHKEIDMVEADTRLVQEQIKQETKIQCNKITADAALQIEQIHAETARISSEISSKCEADVQLLRAEFEATKLQLYAEIEEINMSGDSKAMEIVARAEGVASKKLEKARSHQLEMQRLDLLTSLSKNKQAVVTGNSSNSLLAEMLIANKQSNVLLNVGEGGLTSIMRSA